MTALCLLAVASPPARAQCQIAQLDVEENDPREGFGSAVAVSGDFALIGLPDDEDDGHGYGGKGSAFIFQRFGPAWSRVAKLTAGDAEIGDSLGYSVALDGPVALVGALGDDTHELNTGSAYVFEYADGHWSQVAKLIADDGAEGDFFGTSVAISGDYAVVGAIYDGPGSAYVFERQLDGEWVQAQKLTASDGQGGDEFGKSVAVSGDVIVVGAWGDDDLGWNAGSAYVFERGADSTWSQVAKLLPSDGRFLANIGRSVAVDGKLALIGAPGADGQESWSGAVYVFERGGDATWLEVGKLIASDGQLADNFGFSVALDADVALMGARKDADNGTASGSAYVFVREWDGIWSEVAKLVADDGQAWDYFGRAVDVSGNTGVIGTWPYDVNNDPIPGKAYIYAVGADEDEDGIMDACECPGDLNKDWIVDQSDLGILLADWGCTGGDCPGDADGDGDTDHGDLGLLLANWGEVCP